MANKTLQLKIGNKTYRSSVDNTLTNEDLNNVTLPGLYNAGGSNSVTNKPSGIDHFGLLVIHRASGSYYIQIIYNDSKSYRRFCTNGTWSNWTEDKLTDTTYTSLKNPYALTLKFNSGIGTTYDGSSAVTYDITKTALGMNKVDNTADVDKSVKHAKTADSATTATTLGSATIGSNSCGIYLNAGKPVKMNATVGDAHTPIYFLNGAATACSLTKASVGLGSVDNTSDAKKTVDRANKLKLLVSSRPDSLNFDLTKDPYRANVTYNIATSSTKVGKCPTDGHVLTFGWDTTAGYGSQMAISDGPSPKVYVRGANSSNNATVWDSTWKTLAFTSDIPTSLKNPTALTIQTNGTTAATYDGSAAKTVNITKSSIGLGSVDNTADSAKSVKYATTAGSANAVAWGNVSGKPSTFPPASHTHTKSQITDFPASLKNPTALTVQGNGTTIATYDGSAAKTVNITKASIGLGSVDNTADSAKNVKYATSAGSASKLTTARTVSGGVDIPISFTFDGSANVTASSGFYSASCSSSNTSNYPYHRIAYTPVIKDAYRDYSVMLYLTQGFQGGSFGLIRITVRTNNTNTASGVEAKWLIRSGYRADSVQVGLYNVYGNTYADVFLKISSYGGTVIRALGSDARGSISRTFTLVSSSEAADTTATDAKTSKECWKDIATAATTLHNRAYSAIVAGSDSGVVATANAANSVAWNSVTGKPSTFTPASHTHTKSQITDFPTSLKNPTALTIQTNGTTAATYDGSAAKTVNITKASIGLGNVNNTADSAKSVNYAASAGAVAWGNVSGKPSTFTPASHTHTKSQITDFPSSLKNPTALTVQTNGTTAATYDGSAAKTVNITKASIGLGNVNNTADSAKSVKYATSAGSASKLGSATVGSASTPIYLNGGTATACTGVMKAPIYSTTDLTPGVSDLADGQIYIVYYN